MSMSLGRSGNKFPKRVICQTADSEREVRCRDCSHSDVSWSRRYHVSASQESVIQTVTIVVVNTGMNDVHMSVDSVNVSWVVVSHCS